MDIDKNNEKNKRTDKQNVESWWERKVGNWGSSALLRLFDDEYVCSAGMKESLCGL